MQELTSDQLRKRVDPAEFDFETTAQVKPLERIVGQDRAVRALQFGLEIRDEGYHIYVSGPAGTGKNTAIKAFIETYAQGQPTPNDWCYVHNFRDSYRPKALSLPPGKGRAFKADMEAFVAAAGRQISEAFESEEYARRRAALRTRLEEERHRLLTAVEKEAEAVGFKLRTTQMGLFFVPVMDGKVLEDQDVAALPSELREHLRRIRHTLEERLSSALKELRRFEAATLENVRRLNSEVTRFAIGGLLEDLREKYCTAPEVCEYLAEVESDVVEHAGIIFGRREEGGPEHPDPALMTKRRYEVNVIVDNSDVTGAPVVFEANPSYFHLFGRIEREAHMGMLHTDFTLIKGGSLHAAAGGFLVLQAEDLLRNPLSWDALKRALREREIEMEEPLERAGVPTTKSLRPLPIPLDVKVVLIGSPYLYNLLQARDPEFTELFKVKAEFDTRMDRTPAGIEAYTGLVGLLCARENLCNLDRSALAKIIEYGSRLAEHQEKLSTKFSAIADVLREATHWARRDGSATVKASHVETALRERHNRLNLIETRIQEAIQEHTILIATSGREVGQVNGLSVIAMGELTFGRPHRITCTVALGQQGVVDIEREAKLGGAIHTKGVLILSGFLHENFGQEFPLALSARLVFEQNYGGVDGDSASCAELCALLSRIAGLPIRQDLAITGSVNQKGEVQAIGGVNEKIEGFFDVCKARGLSGTQGVIIPSANMKNLMLREDVVAAVRDGAFHVYAVDRVEEAFELLTGVPAGVRGASGKYPKDSGFYKVHKELERMSRRMRQLSSRTRRRTRDEGAGNAHEYQGRSMK